jgi:hypothetical protein
LEFRELLVDWSRSTKLSHRTAILVHDGGSSERAMSISPPAVADG